MPRFFDDYSNTYLTHDSSAGRKQQRRGWKFRENFRLHYEPHVSEWRRGPMGLASAQQAFLKARGPDDPAVPPLPEGWKEEIDEAIGITYYIDTNTGKRTWVRPGFIPPPPGSSGPPRGPPRGPPMMGGGQQQFNRGGMPPQGYNNAPPRNFAPGRAGPPPAFVPGGGPPPPHPNMQLPNAQLPPPPNMHLPPPPMPPQGGPGYPPQS